VLTNPRKRAVPRPESGTCGRAEEGGNVNIYVGNLSLEVTEDELRREFMAYGEVTYVTIMNDKYIGSGQPRGYGYVEMNSKAEGAAAIANLQGKKLKDRNIAIIEALPLSDRRNFLPCNTREKIRSNKSRQRRFQTV
jgi:RNA recognition motif-containing protein